MRLFVGEAGALALVQRVARLGDQQQYVADPFPKRWQAAVGKHLGAMPGNADAQDEWDSRRAGLHVLNRALAMRSTNGRNSSPAANNTTAPPMSCVAE